MLVSCVLSVIFLLVGVGEGQESPWRWGCQAGVCVKGAEGAQASLSSCLLSCSPESLLWPLPRNWSHGEY